MNSCERKNSNRCGRPFLGEAGFTLVELVLTIILVGILAMSALPKFMDLSRESEIADRDAVLGAVRAGIVLEHAKSAAAGNLYIYPATLDQEKNGTCKKCFSDVLFEPVNDSRWRKTDEMTYQFDDGHKKYTYGYEAESGKLAEK